MTICENKTYVSSNNPGESCKQLQILEHCKALFSSISSVSNRVSTLTEMHVSELVSISQWFA